MQITDFLISSYFFIFFVTHAKITEWHRSLERKAHHCVANMQPNPPLLPSPPRGETEGMEPWGEVQLHKSLSMGDDQWLLLL